MPASRILILLITMVSPSITYAFPDKRRELGIGGGGACDLSSELGGCTRAGFSFGAGDMYFGRVDARFSPLLFSFGSCTGGLDLCEDAPDLKHSTITAATTSRPKMASKKQILTNMASG